MRFKCGPSQAEIDARRQAERAAWYAKQRWHRFYPIWPQEVPSGSGCCRCFEWVERRYVINCTSYATDCYWEYRELQG